MIERYIERFNVNDFVVVFKPGDRIPSRLFPGKNTLAIRELVVKLICPDCNYKVPVEQEQRINCECGFTWTLSRDEETVIVEGSL